MKLTQDIQTFLREGCGASLRHDPAIEEISASHKDNEPGLRINDWIAAWPVEVSIVSPMVGPGQAASIEMYQVTVRTDFPTQAIMMVDASSGSRRVGMALCLNRYELLTLVVCGETFRRLRGFLKNQEEEDGLSGIADPALSDENLDMPDKPGPDESDTEADEPPPPDAPDR